MGILECDDGNNIDGDGCSSKCEIEKGYVCSGGSQTKKDICIDRTKPSIQNMKINSNGTLTLSFTKPVILKSIL